MKIKITKRDVKIVGIQVLIWLALMLVPAFISFFTALDWDDAYYSFVFSAYYTSFSAAVYFTNFCVVIPLFYYRGRRWLFFAVNALLLAVIAWNFLSVDPQSIMAAQPHEELKRKTLSSYYASTAFFLFIYMALAYLALLVHQAIRSRDVKRQLAEEKQRHTEAELEWLKNQLNPHFLFNTLNNISSLIQIDAAHAQESIAQLSDLLRYAMYETRRETVPLEGEVEFMQNYIDLMKLRCNEKTIVHAWFTVANPTTPIAPLLFISLIENAFKHGVSSGRDSRINISLTADNRLLTFVCDNTNYPKDSQNRSGSGIGVENTKRRLALIYQSRYTWEQSLTDNIYHIKITIPL